MNDYEGLFSHDDTHEAVIMNEPKTRSPKGAHTYRVTLRHGELPDMKCGRNGEVKVKTFRPAHIDVEVDEHGNAVETRIYGPEVCKDGSLGKTTLDMRWAP